MAIRTARRRVPAEPEDEPQPTEAEVLSYIAQCRANDAPRQRDAYGPDESRRSRRSGMRRGRHR